MSRYQGKTVVITGAASGLGRGLAEEMAGHGARVMVSDLDAPLAETVAAELTGRGLQVCPHACNVRQAEEVEDLFEQAERRFGPVDYAFANAGFALAGMAHELTAEHFDDLFEVNLMGVVRCCQTAYRRMRPRRSGHIVTTASLAGLVGLPGMLAYSTSKAAVVRYSLDLRLEAGQHGVKVTTLCPAFLSTGLFSACRTVNLDIEHLQGRLPLPISPLQPAVRALLRGIDRNQAVVTYPRHATFLWWLNRFSPSLGQPLSVYLLKHIQSARREDFSS
ncbi:SDR family oxidoreductase [bacterium CPR1]|nr:SDR family oxidoreductase [bacterium CPR1]